jgi:glutamyl-tRNA synthetase
VVVDMYNGPMERVLPKHKKNPDVGTKVTTYTNKIIVEPVDAASFDLGEEVYFIARNPNATRWLTDGQITLMDWGNAIVRQKIFAEDGSVSSVTVDLHLEGDFKSTKKKVMWLSRSSDHPLMAVTLLDYDYNATKKKLEDGDNWEEFITPTTEFREGALADTNVLDMTGEGQDSLMQFERKGYYDGRGTDGRLEFVRIPDGRAVYSTTPSSSQFVTRLVISTAPAAIHHRPQLN